MDTRGGADGDGVPEHDWAMKKLLGIALGIVTSIGGFLDAGSIVTAAQAGASFRYTLLWTLLLGTICLIFLVEMSGRLAAVSGYTIAGAMRARFGFSFFVLPLVVVVLVAYLVLASEIGGVAVALQLATGISYRWWAILVALLAWLVLWRGTFGVIENGISLLGLVTIMFIIGLVKHHPAWGPIAAGFLPTRPSAHGAQFWFLAVSIIGATIAPYLLYFYSSGAVEDHWDERHLGVNRAVATLGMSFGTLLSAAIIILGGSVFFPKGIRVERYERAAPILNDVLGGSGVALFIASLAIVCLGATLEVALSAASFITQGFGWNWSEDARPRQAARFSAVYTVLIVLATIPLIAGVQPLGLTVFSMALTAASLPVTIGPLLILMNDEDYVGEHGNGPVSNAVVVFTIVLAFVLAVVTIPLVITGS